MLEFFFFSEIDLGQEKVKQKLFLIEGNNHEENPTIGNV